MLDFRIFCDVFSKHFLNNILEGQKIEKKGPTRQQGTHFSSARRNARPPGERKREGGKPKMQEIQEAGWMQEKSGKKYDKKYECVSSTPCTPSVGGGSLRAFRRAMLSDPGNDDHKKSAATKTTKSTFRCCEFWGAAGTEQWFSRFCGCTFHVEGTKFLNLPPILPKTTQNSKISENFPKNRKNPSKS